MGLAMLQCCDRIAGH